MTRERIRIVGLALLISTYTVSAYQGMPIRPLQIVGRYLKDDQGKIVILHGWMQPSGWYWNGRAFPDPVEYTPEECAPALQVYKLQVDVLTTTNPIWGKSHGCYHTFVRFGESPGWDAVNNLQNPERFERYINNLLVPYVDYCATRGVYVCFVGGANTTNWMSAQHKANLIEYFRRIAGHPGIKNKPNVMFEICNEPVAIESELGNDHWVSDTPAADKAIQKFMQDIVDAIRSTGATNVIWVPGLIWQGRLQNFAKYPIHGINIGYAGHWYPIGEDNPTNILRSYTNDWKKCSDVAPIIVTEGSWHTMAEDQGLRRGTTEGFGKTQRYIRDTAENISWMAGMNGEVIGNLDYPPGGTNYTFPTIACGQAAFDWWPSYAWCAPSSIDTEAVLEQSLKVGDKLAVNANQTVAQSFKYGPKPGGPNFKITKLRIFLSKSASQPNADLLVSICTNPTGEPIPGTLVSIPPYSIPDSSEGTTFATYDITYPAPIGPLAAGTTYYILFTTESTNSYFVQISSLSDSHTGTVDDLYPRGAAYTNGIDTGRDVRFIITGSDLPTVPLPPTNLVAQSLGGNRVKLSWTDSRIAAGYNVKRATNPGGPYELVCADTKKNYYIDSGLPSGKTFYYVVSAINPAGESPNSQEVSITIGGKLSGMIIGSPGSWANSGNTIDHVFDGDLETYYDATAASGHWVGLDLGAPFVITQIKYCPRRGYAGRMVGGRFEGANVPDFSTGVVTLLTITTTPPEGVLTSRTINNANAFRYVRYIGPANGYCNVAEVEFWTSTSPNPPPAPPSGLTVYLSNRIAYLHWEPSVGATAYRVKRSTTKGGPYTPITNVSGTSCIDLTLPRNTLFTWRYYYVISAINANGESTDSPEMEVIMPPSAPTRVTASLDLWRAKLWWDFPGGADTYVVKKSELSGGPYTVVATNLVHNTFVDPEQMDGKKFYFYVISAINTGGESPDSAEVVINPPYPWMTREIGAGGGDATYSNGVFIVNGSGADIWGNSDSFRFVYIPVTGNCSIVTKVVSVAPTDPWAKAGVMIRASLDADSAHAFMCVTPSNGVAFQYRITKGGGSYNNNLTGLSAPYWVRLVRSGNTFTGYRSADGKTWTTHGSATISMPSAIYIGLAVTAHNTSTNCMAVFEAVGVTNIVGGTQISLWTNWTVPDSPDSVSAKAGDAQVYLTWTPINNATTYRVKRSLTDGGPYKHIANISTTNFIDTQITNGLTYYYVVTAVNPAGESSPSPQVSVTPLPPPMLTVTTENSVLQLAWPSHYSDFILQYRTNLLIGDWVAETSAVPQLINGKWIISIPLSTNTETKFYRLVK